MLVGELQFSRLQTELRVLRRTGDLTVVPGRLVAHRENRAHRAPVRGENRTRIAHRQDFAAVRSPDTPARLEHRLSAQDGTCEGKLRGRIRQSRFGEQVIAVGILVRRNVEPRHAMQPCRGGVDEGDAALRIRDDHALRELCHRNDERGSHTICSQLGVIGSWHRIDAMCRETNGRMADRMNQCANDRGGTAAGRAKR